MKCKICNNEDKNSTLLVREMMFGTEEVFTYLECSICGCLQIVNQRAANDTYPLNYYSFQKSKVSDNMRNSIFAALSKKKDSYALFKKGIVSGLIQATREKNALLDFMSSAHVRRSSRVLDIGCGAGRLLSRLRVLGFVDLIGVDPHAQEYECPGLKICSKTIEDLEDDRKFDVIIFSHSLEHIPDQLATLRKVSVLLSGDGICLVRMPVKTEYIWKLYGTNWVQIDAPRHYIIHTVKSFELLCSRANMVIEDVVFDSTKFQFVGSEQYKRDIPWESPRSYHVDPQKSIFSAKEIRKFKKQAKELNRAEQGDQAAFLLRKRPMQRKITISPGSCGATPSTLNAQV